jgi:hypothetical protein
MTATAFRIVAPRGRPAVSVVARMIGVLRRPWATCRARHGLSYFHLWGFDDSRARGTPSTARGRGQTLSLPGSWAIAPMACACPRRGTSRRYTIAKIVPLAFTAAFAGLIEDTSHLPIAFGVAVAVVRARTLLAPRAGAIHDPRCFDEGNVAAVAPTSAIICRADGRGEQILQQNAAHQHATGSH